MIMFGSVDGKNSTPVGATKNSAITATSVPRVAVSRRARLSVSRMYGEPNEVCSRRSAPKATPSAPNTTSSAGSSSIPITTSTPWMVEKSSLPPASSSTISTPTTAPKISPALTLTRPPRNAVSRLWITMPMAPTASRMPPGTSKIIPAGAVTALIAAPAISSTKPSVKAPRANVLRSKARLTE